ncbi:MAG TPA: hypothetical protein DCG49_02125 [Ruminococcus sp.]|nr:hypothetical protein [Ruminococcus sp.]
MLGSDYRELIVPKLDNTMQKTAVTIGGILLTALCTFIALGSGAYLLLLGSLIFGFGTWFLRTRCDIEYEYVMFDDEFRITKIMGQSKRKPLLTVSLNQFQAFGKLADAPPASDNQTLVLACSAQDDSAYYADFLHNEHGQTRLILTPNDDILSYLSQHLPRSLNFRLPQDH